MRDPFDFFVIIMGIWIALIPLYFLVIGTDGITIEYNYLDELKQCKLDLENTQPICPKVEVKPTGWFFPLLIGFLLGISIQELWIKYQRERNKNLQKNSIKQTRRKK